jgi:hypothetical protein
MKKLTSAEVLQDRYEYQVGGSLSQEAPSYVVRQADHVLYQALSQGELCYVFNSRQMGKSSLRVRVKHKLQQQGVHCASVDLTRLGSENLSPAQWYKGIAAELWRGFGLINQVNLIAWYREQLDLSPAQQLSRFIEEILLKSLPGNLVIFIDEVDSVLSLGFSVDDFFALIRACHNQRAENPAYNRLTFALFGVATPSDLIQDASRTPFNLGKAIELQGFTLEEAKPLAAGLLATVEDPRATLKAIFDWTGGQPFLTQKLCRLVQEQGTASALPGSSAPSISVPNTASYLHKLMREVMVHHSDPAIQLATLVQSRIIDHWEMQDHPEHLKTIQNRLWRRPQRLVECLNLYQQILRQGWVSAEPGSAQTDLLLSGLVIKQNSQLRVFNRIYATVFNQQWVKQSLVRWVHEPPSLPIQPPAAPVVLDGGNGDGQPQDILTAFMHQLEHSTPQQIEALAQIMAQHSPNQVRQLAERLLAYASS